MSSNKDGWVTDPVTGKSVRWHATRKCWVNKDGVAVRSPQTTPVTTTVAASGSARGSGVPALTQAMGAMTLPSQSAVNTRTAMPATHGSSDRADLSYAATLSDPASGVKTRWEVGATTRFQDPVNSNSNRTINLKRIRDVEGNKDKSVAQAQQNEYKVYRVIEVLLVPPEDAQSNVSRITPTGSGSVRLRRFVIVREIPDRGCIEALPIKTYSFRGVAAPGVIKSHHSIIYTGSKRPVATVEEAPGRSTGGMVENGMQPQAIRIKSFDLSKALDPMARLDYADRYEFDWGVPNMRVFGRVHEDSQAALFVQYNSVWSSITSAVRGAMPTPQPSVQSSANTSAMLMVSPSSVGTRGSSTAANYGSSKGTAGSSVSVPATSAKALLQRYAARNSGPCTEQQIRAILQYLQDRAQQEGLPMPDINMTAAQLTGLARNAESRAHYIQKIRDHWQMTTSWRTRKDDYGDEDIDEEDDDDENDDND